MGRCVVVPSVVFMDTLQQINTHKALADVIRRAIPHIIAVYVYGSVARGDNSPDSDLDIALLLPPGQQLPDKLALAQELYNATGREVDLVDLRRAGHFLRMEVLRQGQTILNADPAYVLAWEGQAMSQYAQHRAQISGILESFQRTGIGHHQ